MGGLFGGGDGSRAAANAARAGERAAQQIKSDPFDITKQTEETKKRAGKEFERSRTRSERTSEQQQGLIQQLEARARGEGPSLAQAQLKSAQERTLAQQLAAAGAQRGGSPAALARNLARSQAESGQQLGQQAAQVGLQEQQAAQQQLGQQLAQEQALSDQLTAQFLQQGFSVEQARAGALQELERLRANARAQGASTSQQAAAAAQQSQSQLVGSLLGGAATIGGALIGGPAGAAAGSALATPTFGTSGVTSDENQKMNIESADKDTQAFLNAISSKKYDYKDTSLPGTAEGKRFGIMAQDLEKSEMGKSFVREAAHGKMVDTVQGFGAVLAAQSLLNKRLNKLEKKGK